LVARPLWERKAAGSNPVTPTVAQKALNCEDAVFTAFLLARIAMRMPWPSPREGATMTTRTITTEPMWVDR